jgi:lambda family phage minor tail protein L
MRELTPELLAESRRVHNPDPWLDLWQIEVDVSTTARVVLAITNAPEPIRFPSGDPMAPVYHPFPCARGDIEWDDQAGVPRTTLTIANIRREVALYLEQGQGLMDRTAVLATVHRAHLASIDQRIPFRWIISGAQLDAAAVVLQLESRAFLDAQVPRDAYMRDRCRWRFRGPECGYEPDPTLGANYQTCKKDFADCVLRGDDEAARGIVRQHPAQYGGFPGIPRRVR